tara:strand:+ start:21412 stop:21672 length:261 start_codon:yes stop_codon:yes gene_type:complete
METNMGWDSTAYILHRIDELTRRVTLTEQTTLRHQKKIDLIESWKSSLQTKIRKWPYIVAPLIVIGLNVAPKETVQLLLATIKAAI